MPDLAIISHPFFVCQFAGKQQRSIEDLKGRYYSIARQLMIAREGNQEDIENYTLIKAPYDANHEK